MQLPAAVPALAASLRRQAEHRMVRHESAEALGAIEFAEDDSAGANARDALLREFSSEATEPDQAVRESCVVALDTNDYWSLFGNTDQEVDASDAGSSAKGQPSRLISFAQQKAGDGGHAVGAVPTTADLQASHFNTVH